MKRWFMLAGCLSAVACSVPFVPLKDYTRTEDFTPGHARWLNAHCQLMDTTTTTLRGGGLHGDRGNYLMHVGQFRGPVYDDGSSILFEASLVYACSEPTPWPREDRALVRQYYEDGLHSPQMARCSGAPFERPVQPFRIVEPGTGAAPTKESYAKYRVTPVVVIPPARQKEADEWGVVAGPQGSWVAANHILCSSFRDALMKLKVGGKAHVTITKPESNKIYNVEVGPDMLEFDVELLALGDVKLLYEQVGLTP